jgi:hypothetical protein
MSNWNFSDGTPLMPSGLGTGTYWLTGRRSWRDFDFSLWHWLDFGLDQPIPEGYICMDLSLQVGGELEYLHRSPASHKRRHKMNPVPGGITGPPCSWGYKYGNLALQVGGVSDETAKYGFGFWATRTIEWLHCKLQTHPLVREGAQ